jgi:squalene synthase HpnC
VSPADRHALTRLGAAQADGPRPASSAGRAEPGQPVTQPGDAQVSLITAGAAAKAPAENFPVAMRLLPRRYRRHLMAVYEFARTVDDIGDEALPGQAAGPDRRPDAELVERRLRLLDELEADIDRLRTGAPPRAEVIARLAPTVAECAIPDQLLRDLIQANRQDQLTGRYQTFDDLLGYCVLSANPVGRMVLHIFDAVSPRQAKLSDHICSALQLAEHWQDVAEDLRADRIYIPAEDLDRFGCTEADLAAPSAGDNVRALMAFQVARASALLSAGSPLIGTLPGAARVAVAGYVAGGRAALAAIRAADYDVLAATPRPGKRRLVAEAARAYTKGR